MFSSPTTTSLALDPTPQQAHTNGPPQPLNCPEHLRGLVRRCMQGLELVCKSAGRFLAGSETHQTRVESWPQRLHSDEQCWPVALADRATDGWSWPARIN